MTEAAGAGQVRFFNVSLINANVMSLPRFPEPQRLVGELIHSIEAVSPRFAWVQFLFRRANYSPSLVALKNAMNLAAAQIKTPKTSLIDDSEYDRPELHRDWYKRSGERIKRIDALVNSPHVLLAIQGMWVGDPRRLSSLPFKDCYDELDRLGTFVYRNPWMLVELVERRMVEDISSYIMSYAHSRMEPPSFLITREEVPYYLHLPVSKGSDFLKSLTEKAKFSADIPPGDVEKRGAEGEAAPTPITSSTVLRLVKVPDISEPLKEQAVERLALLPSTTTRGFEVVYAGGATSILLSSGTKSDLQEYLATFESVYGALNTIPVVPRPEFLSALPGLLGLKT